MKRFDHALTPTRGNNWRSLMDERDNGDYVLYREAAAIIAEKDLEIEALQNKVDALQEQLAEVNRRVFTNR